MEADTADDIKQIRTDLDLLTNLYAKLVNRLVPEEEPEPEDIEAIESKEKVRGEDELFRALNK
jgi:hypothetical protein